MSARRYRCVGAAREQRDSASAIVNLLEDATDERQQLEASQRAVLNILEDSAEERDRLIDAQRAVMNIAEDAAAEQARLEDTRRAVMNIAEDAAAEQVRLADTQRAVLNILDDAAAEQARLADTQRALLNILDDFELEKRKVEEANAELRAEIAERVRVEAELRLSKQEAENASRELEAFSYSVAHDLRAPLRSIDGFSQALLEEYAGQFDDEGQRYLGRVRESARHMGELIDDLLNLARVTRIELKRVTVDLSALVEQLLGRLREENPQRAVKTVIAPGLEVSADRRLLEVALVNLLSNAWKFTSKREVARIEVGATGDSPRVFYVRDNGAGFNPAFADKLFGVFQRLHAARDFEGTGIGLATVQRIIQRHGGRIWAEGEVDQGATFYFTLGSGGAQ